jgi:MFS family permease
MASKDSPTPTARDVVAASWLPLVIIVLAQLQMGINVNALPVSLGPIIADINAPATSVSTALVLYSLFVAAFVMMGAKVGKMFGERLVFQISVLAHGASMALMALSTDASMMNTAQAIAGISAALLVPTLVVLIAANYRERQQEQSLGILASIPAIASGLTFVIAGAIATALSWRYSFGLIFIMSIVVFILSFRLKPLPRTPGIRIDLVGVVLSAAAIALILFGFNNLNNWGLLIAKDGAPFSILGVSPAPIFIILGIVFGQAFFAWSEKRVMMKRTPLLAMEVLDSPEEKNAVLSFLFAGGIGPAVSFLIPLYIQIVLGRTPLQTSFSIVPYALAVAAAAILSVRLYAQLSPRRLGVISFVLLAVGLVLLGLTVSNEWSTLMVILGLIIVGLGEGTMLTLLFNVLVSASPKELAGDVGALRGVVNNVSSALGAAFAGVIAVGLLSIVITTAFGNSNLPASLEREINFDKIDFVSNEQLKDVLGQTSATPEQVDEAVRINEDARLRALRATFFLLAALSLLSIFPATKLPNYTAGELPIDELLKDTPVEPIGEPAKA